MLPVIAVGLSLQDQLGLADGPQCNWTQRRLP
jgi:hypothetical protein